MSHSKGRGFLIWGICISLILGFSHKALAGEKEGSEGIYYVREGDTLWDISKTLLNDPFLWPSIWEKNKYITDPNRIYPGDPLVIPGLQATPPPEKAPIGESSEKVVLQPQEVKPELIPAEAPKIVEAPKEAEKPEIEAKVKLELPPLPPIPIASQEAIACSGFIAEKDLPDMGSILKPLADKTALAWGDIVFITLRGTSAAGTSAKVGDRFDIFREGAKVWHPNTMEPLGTKVKNLGYLEVIEVEGESIRSRILSSCEEIRVGDRLRPHKSIDFPFSKVPKPTTAKLEGYIVAAQEEALGLAARQIVFIDQGSQAGVGPGDVFLVYREGETVVGPLPKGEISLSRTILGELVVLHPGEKTATAIITRSVEELRIGDRISLSKKIVD